MEQAADTFVFNRALRKSAEALAGDVIADFTSADVIDLHAIDANTTAIRQPIVFIYWHVCLQRLPVNFDSKVT